MALHPLQHQLRERNLKGVVSFFLKGLVNKARKLFVTVCEQSKWKEEPADHRQIWPISISPQHSLESGCALTTDIPWLPPEQFISKEHRS